MASVTAAEPNPKPGARNFCLVSHEGAAAQEIRASSAVFLGHEQGTGPGGGAAST